MSEENEPCFKQDCHRKTEYITYVPPDKGIVVFKDDLDKPIELIYACWHHRALLPMAVERRLEQQRNGHELGTSDGDTSGHGLQRIYDYDASDRK